MWFISEFYNYGTKRLYNNTKLQIKYQFFEVCLQFSFLFTYWGNILREYSVFIHRRNLI